MKKIKIILFSLLCVFGLFSCKDDQITKLNYKAEDGTLSFKLNNPRYSNYILEDAQADKDMDSLTCVQPDYSFTAAVTYTTQVCFDATFAAGTYQSLATTVNGEKIGINTKQMDKAIIALYGGKLPDPVVIKDVYVRLSAYISDATHSALTDSLIVKPLYSNVIKLRILPYVLPLFPYTEVAPRLWYIVGLGGNWTNSIAGLGSSLIPMSIQDGKKYNLSGDGEFIYTGYIKASDGFKILRTIGDWNNNIWGMTGTTYTLNSGGNITVPSDGYYKVTLNSIDNTLTISPITISPAPTLYTSIGLIGAFNGWGGDVALTTNTGTSGHVWYTTYTFAADSQCKLRANADWGTSWGIPGSDDGIALYSKMAVAVKGGKNMIETAGTYTVILNDIDGCYFFIKK